MSVILKSESWQVIGFSRHDGTQFKFASASSLEKLLMTYAKWMERHLSMGEHNNILPSFQKITVWNVDKGFTGLDLPYIPAA